MGRCRRSYLTGLLWFAVCIWFATQTGAALAVSAGSADRFDRALQHNDPIALAELLESANLDEVRARLARGLLQSYRLEDKQAMAGLRQLGEDETVSPDLRHIAFVSLAGIGLRRGLYRQAVEDFRTARDFPEGAVDEQTRRANTQTSAILEALAEAPDMATTAQGSGRLDLRNRLGVLTAASVAMNGQTIEAVLDTGAGLTTLSRSMAERLGVSIFPDPISVGTASRDSVGVRVGLLETLRIGRLTMRNLAVLAVDDADMTLSPGQRLDAIIGLPVIVQLGRITVSMDRLGRGTLVYEPGPVRPAAQANLFVTGVSPVVSLQTAQVPRLLSLFLDTGAATSTLQPRALEEFPALRRQAEARVLSTVGIGGRTRVDGFVIERLPARLGGRDLIFRELEVRPFGQARQHGTIGQDVLRGFGGYVLDFSAMRLELPAPSRR